MPRAIGWGNPIPRARACVCTIDEVSTSLTRDISSTRTGIPAHSRSRRLRHSN